MGFAGFSDVTLADSAVEAAQIIAEANPPFDCMFIDFKMPEINGDYLCTWVRNLPQYQTTPLVMVTALGQKPDIDRAFAAGATDYITKPVDLADLIARLKLLARQVAQLKADAAAAPQKETTPDPDQALTRIDFTKPMHLGGIKGEIDLASLENYLVQISRNSIHEMSAFSFAIKDAAKLHLVCSRKGFIAILKATGRAISTHLETPNFFIAYAGYGTFTGVIESKNIDENEREALEATVRKSLDGITVASRNGAPSKIEPYMAMPRKLGTWSGTKVVDAMYHTIGEAEDRCKAIITGAAAS